MDDENRNDEEYNFEEGAKKFGAWFSKSLPIIFTVLISIFFIFYGTVEILPTQLSLKEQTIMVFITIVAGWSITTLVGEGGFSSAKNSKKFKETTEGYNEAVHKALKYRGGVNQLAKKRAKENLMNLRIRYCEAVNLYYWDIFDDNGYLKKDFDITQYKKWGWRKYRKIKAYYKRAVNLHVRNIDVFSKSESSKFGIRKEANESTYRTKNGLIKLIFKVALSICTVGVMFNFLGFSAGAAIYAFMQVVLWVGMGVVERLKNYNFIIDRVRPQIDDRRVLIEEFLELEEADKNAYMIMAKEEEALKHTKVKMIEYKNDFKNNESNI